MYSGSDLRILLAGATGLTGRAVLKLLLTDERVKEVHVPLRSPLPLQHSKLHPHPWKENAPRFEELPDLPFDAVLCCLGTTLKKAGSREAFQRLDRDAVLELGHWTELRGVHRMLVISSEGANPDSMSFYLRTKGEMEKGLEKLGIPSTTVLRPGLLLGRREEFRLAERLGQSLLPIFGYRGTPVDSLARFLVDRIFESKPGFSTIENRQILAGRVRQS